MCLAIGIDVHSKKLTSFAVPQDEENIDESEFCLEFNKEFKSTPADRTTLNRMAAWLNGREHLILIENSTKGLIRNKLLISEELSCNSNPLSTSL